MDISALIGDNLKSIPLERNFSFARHTTIGCGGTASVAAYPQGSEETATFLELLHKHGIPYCFLGAGANVLPADGYFDGVVIRFSRMNRMERAGERLTVGAGVTGGGLLRAATALGLGGFEFLTGIPMTLGGGVVMNAGVGERHLADVVERVVGIENGKIREFSLKECDFSEKRSIFQSGIAVTAVTLRGAHMSPDEIESERNYFCSRRAHLPKGRSMGCTFVNPSEGAAGAIIDACGLKGISCGRARVSEIHANFIINDGATASEISSLIALVKRKVFLETGILLREEIRRIP